MSIMASILSLYVFIDLFISIHHEHKQSNVAKAISTQVSIEFARTLNVVYFPQLGTLHLASLFISSIAATGYLICVPMLDEWRSDTGIQAPEGWTFQFLSEYVRFGRSGPKIHQVFIVPREYVYFKSQEMRGR